VTADDVAGPGGRAADGVVGRRTINLDTPGSVAQGVGAAGVCADEVADHGVRRAALQGNAFQSIRGDEVAGAGRGAADRVVRGIAINQDAPVSVAQWVGAVDV